MSRETVRPRSLFGPFPSFVQDIFGGPKLGGDLVSPLVCGFEFGVRAFRDLTRVDLGLSRALEFLSSLPLGSPLLRPLGLTGALDFAFCARPGLG